LRCVGTPNPLQLGLLAGRGCGRGGHRQSSDSSSKRAKGSGPLAGGRLSQARGPHPTPGEPPPFSSQNGAQLWNSEGVRSWGGGRNYSHPGAGRREGRRQGKGAQRPPRPQLLGQELGPAWISPQHGGSGKAFEDPYPEPPLSPSPVSRGAEGKREVLHRDYVPRKHTLVSSQAPRCRGDVEENSK
jgi:hypothetical protein